MKGLRWYVGNINFINYWKDIWVYLKFIREIVIVIV